MYLKHKKLQFIFLLLVILYFFWPIAPSMPAIDLDSSWVMVMNYAVDHHFIWGRDIVYNFGFFPYLFTFAYDPQLFSYLLAFWFLFLLTMFVYLYSFFQSQQSFFSKLFLTFIFFWCVTYNPNVFYPIYCFVFFLYLLEERNFNFWVFLGCVLLAVVTLIKFSFSLFALLLILIFTFIDLKDKRFPWKFLTYFFALAIFYKLNHQPFSDVLPFISGIVQIIVGYNSALQWSNPLSPIPELFYFFVAVLLLKYFFDVYHHRFGKLSWFLFFFLGVSLFLTFKNCFIRADSHVFGAFGFELCLLILFFLVYFSRFETLKSVANKKHIVFLIILAVCMFPISRVNIDMNSIKEFRSTFNTPGFAPKYQLLKAFLATSSISFLPHINSFAIVFNYPHLREQYETSLVGIQSNNPLPKVVGNADLYPDSQAVLLANGITYNPRPVFQSYSAYTPKLLEFNCDHLLSAQAPDNVFFMIHPMDQRYPNLEDSVSWLVLLTHYHLRPSQGPYLWLVKSNEPKQIIIRPLVSATYHVGEEVSLPEGVAQQQLVWVKIVFTKNLFSGLIAMIYRPSQIIIDVTMVDGRQYPYRLVTGIASSGFLLSPLVENTQDFVKLYTAGGREELFISNRIKGFSITYLGWQKFFTPKEYHVQFFGLQEK